MQYKVYILTGAIQTGKTTALQQWCSQRHDVSGVFTPVLNNKRFFVNIATQETFAMEAMEGEADVLKIGKFVFSTAAFAKANTLIAKANSNYVVIDEIGPLELMEQGLHYSFKNKLQNQASHIIVVVREGLVREVINHFNISNPIIITKTTLEQL
jgi:nucleoside-triphosphatase